MVASAKKPRVKNARHFIKEWRKYRRLTQEVLAEKAGMTAGAISQLESGIINYTQPSLEALANALGCTPADLLGREPGTETKRTPDELLHEALVASGLTDHWIDLAFGAIDGLKTAMGKQSPSASDDRSERPTVRRGADSARS